MEYFSCFLFLVFNVAKFTNLGGHGRYGPMSIGTHYHGQDHDGQVTVTNGVQMWKVPATGLYALEAAGASGGYDKFSGMIYTLHLKMTRTLIQYNTIQYNIIQYNTIQYNTMQGSAIQYNII